MIGQYTLEAMKVKTANDTWVSSLDYYFKGLIKIRINKTLNCYRLERDGSWTNYDCQTKGN